MGTDVSKSINVTLYSTFGVVAYSKQITVGGAVAQLDMANIGAGVYIIKVKTDLSESSTKIFKK